MREVNVSITTESISNRGQQAGETTKLQGSAVDHEVRIGAYSWYVLSFLTIVYGVQFIDRQLVSILLEPIKKEFVLTDAQLGFLSSFVFGAAYSIACVPLGILCDRVSRKRLLACLLAVWSAFTAMSGLAQSYTFLVAARIAVGVAESGNNTSGMSLLSDYFSPRNRATAFGVYFVGQAFGIFGGFLVGGIVAAAYGWRMAFFVVGIPGVFLALLLWTTIREPLRGTMAAKAAVAKEFDRRYSLMETFRWLITQRSAGFMVIANMVTSIAAAGIIVWYASFMIRQHGMSVRTAGISIGIGIGLATAIGSTAGGLLSDFVGRHGMRWRALFIAATVGAAIPFFVCGLFASKTIFALILLSVGAAVNAAQYGATFSLIQGLVMPTMRGTAASLSQLANNLIGYGCGPLIVGLLSDHLQPLVGFQSLRFAICAVMVFQLIGVCFIWLASRTIERDASRTGGSA